jgi:hypothetical protein
VTKLVPFAALIGLLTTFAPAGQAQPTEASAQLESRHREAEAACSSGRLEEGVGILSELFAQTDDGNYIFNQARCYQQNGRKAEALARFQMYLQRSDADPAAAARARQYTLELQPLPPTDSVSSRPEEPDSAEASPIGRTLRVAGLWTSGAGLAALAGATIFGMSTTRYEKEGRDYVTMTMNPDPVRVNAINERGRRAEVLQWVCLGVGATAVSTGALLYYLGLRAASRPESTALHLSPLPLRAGGGLLLQGTF